MNIKIIRGIIIWDIVQVFENHLYKQKIRGFRCMLNHLHRSTHQAFYRYISTLIIPAIY